MSMETVRPMHTVHVAHPHLRPVPLSYKSLTMFYNRSLDQALSDNQVLIDELKDVLKQIETDFKPDDIESYYTNELANYRKKEGVGRENQKQPCGNPLLPGFDSGALFLSPD